MSGIAREVIASEAEAQNQSGDLHRDSAFRAKIHSLIVSPLSHMGQWISPFIRMFDVGQW